MRTQIGVKRAKLVEKYEKQDYSNAQQLSKRLCFLFSIKKNEVTSIFFSILQVSWFRRSSPSPSSSVDDASLSVLTVGRETFSADGRFSAPRAAGDGDDW